MANTQEGLKSEEPAQRRRRKLGQILVDSDLLTPNQLTDALSECQRAGKRLGQILLETGLVSEHDLTLCLSNQLGYQFVDLLQEDLNPALSAIIPEPLAKRYQSVPLRLEGKALTVAMTDPMDFDAIQDLSFLSGCVLKPMIACRAGIAKALEVIYAQRDAVEVPFRGMAIDSTEDYDPEILEVLPDIAPPTATDMEIQTLEESTRRAPIVRLCNMITTDAVRSRASDIHIEPNAKDTTVRYRIDGLLRVSMHLPKNIHGSLISRYKVLSKLDIAERRLPQDGAVRLQIEGRQVDLRVSTMLTQYGEKMVLRISDQSKALIRLDTLGLSDKDFGIIKSFTYRRKGIILVTGPTGSGKTKTLYALIHAIRSPTLNLITIEDPIEANIEGINQTQVNPDAGITFARALRSILRQDPDVILVGEIRDHETAEMAVRAAMTGHLVLATLHTNDAPSAITRLIDLAIPRYLVSSLVEGVIAQRLVRTICPNCKQETTPSPSAMMTLKIQPEALANVKFYAGKGCQQCGGTGYYGRMAVVEVLDPTARIREMIGAEASEQELRLAALAVNMTSIGEDGLNKAKAGLTTVEELLRVIEVASKIESICPTCASNVQYDFHVCPFCGTLLNQNCESCRRPLQLDWNICPFCGTRVGTAPRSSA